VRYRTEFSGKDNVGVMEKILEAREARTGTMANKEYGFADTVPDPTGNEPDCKRGSYSDTGD
jgi:hypothetical protein